MSATVTREKCWKEGCEEPRSDERNGYWCTRHHDERRERITAEMAKLANDSYGIPRNHGGTGVPFVAHDISVESNFYGWHWLCSCGKRGATDAKTEGLARAASYRHLRAVEKAA